MNSRLILLILTIAGFGVLTATALMDVGYWGIVAPHFKSWGAAQVLSDLTISCVLACIWMIHDGGKMAWPFVLITLVAGSFGPLLYLAARELRAARKNAGRPTHLRTVKTP